MERLLVKKKGLKNIREDNLYLAKSVCGRWYIKVNIRNIKYDNRWAGCGNKKQKSIFGKITSKR